MRAIRLTGPLAPADPLPDAYVTESAAREYWDRGEHWDQAKETIDRLIRLDYLQRCSKS